MRPALRRKDAERYARARLRRKLRTPADHREYLGYARQYIEAEGGALDPCGCCENRIGGGT